jgi:hypothetical protein
MLLEEKEPIFRQDQLVLLGWVEVAGSDVRAEAVGTLPLPCDGVDDPPAPIREEGFLLVSPEPLFVFPSQRTERAGGEMCVDVFHLMEKLYPQKW